MRQWRETWGGWEAGPSFQAEFGIRSFFSIPDLSFQEVSILVPEMEITENKNQWARL